MFVFLIDNKTPDCITKRYFIWIFNSGWLRFTYESYQFYSKKISR
jgi:hypothetical protein